MNMNENVNEIIENLKTEIHLAEYVEADYKDNVSVDLLRNAFAIITEQKRKLDKISDIISEKNGVSDAQEFGLHYGQLDAYLDDIEIVIKSKAENE